jgi:hypothetical protein
MNGYYAQPNTVRSTRTALRDIVRIIKHWPAASKDAAERMIAAYGPPNEGMESQLAWHNREPWKLTIIFRDGVWHNFPQPHLDILRQTVNYRVPKEKVNDVCAFDGSIVIDRTRGEMSVCSESERMNILAINLAHNIIKGTLSVEEARRKFTEAVVAMRLNWPVPDAEKLEFSTIRDYEFQHSTADPDTATIGGSLVKGIKRLFR